MIVYFLWPRNTRNVLLLCKSKWLTNRQREYNLLYDITNLSVLFANLSTFFIN